MPERRPGNCRVVVIWIDWYPYHVARFRGLTEAMPEQVIGIELVGGTGVHTGLKFREDLPSELAIQTLMPTASWHTASHFKLARLLWSRLSLLDPEVVLVPGYYTLPAIAAALWARIHGRASVLMTESTVGDHERSWWKETLKRIGLKTLFNWAVAGGKAHLAYLEQLRFSSQRVTDSYDVVDNGFFLEGTNKLRQLPPSSQLPSSPFFLYVGRLAPEKNVVTLLQGWLIYREQGGSWPLVLVGDGPEASTLKASAAASPYIRDVLFPGLKSSRELLPFYSFAGCFVLPSTREPWGLVVNEAMASALPVIVSSHCGCAPDLIIPNRNGFLFEPNDFSGLTALLHRVESLTIDDLRRMGRASAEIVAGFSPAGFGRSVARIAATRPSPHHEPHPLHTVIGGSR